MHRSLGRLLTGALAALALTLAGGAGADGASPLADAPQIQAGSMCRVDGPPREPAPTLEQAMATIQAAMLAEGPQDDVRPLNGRGYNYPSAAGQVNTRMIQLEEGASGR